MPALLSIYEVQEKELLRSENAVSGIAKTGNDVGILIQMIVHCSHIDIYVGMCFLNLCNTFGNCYKAHEADVGAAAILEHGDGIAGGTAGSEHGIGDYHETVVNIFGELAVILYRFVGFFVAVETDMANLCHRYKGLERVDHSESCKGDRC